MDFPLVGHSELNRNRGVHKHKATSKNIFGPTPYSLFAIPCSLFPVPYSLFPIPCPLARVPGSGRFPISRRTVKVNCGR